MGSGPGPRLAECLLRYIWAMNWAQPGQGTPSGHGPGGDGWSNPTARFDAAAAGDGFGAGPELELVTPNRPPVIWLGIALLLVVVAVVVGLVGGTATTGLIGWLLAGPAAISTIAVFSVADARRRESGWYTPSDLADWGRRIIIVAALVAVTLCAWFIANDVARGQWR